MVTPQFKMALEELNEFIIKIFMEPLSIDKRHDQLFFRLEYSNHDFKKLVNMCKNQRIVQSGKTKSIILGKYLVGYTIDNK